MKKITPFLLLVAVGVFAAACQTGVKETPETGSESKQEEPTKNVGPKEASANAKSRAGGFEGKSDHITKGTAKIEVADDGTATVVLGDDFDFDGAPAPVVALGKDGYKKETILGKLEKNKGSQTYKIPDTLKASDFDEVWIWCTQVDAPLGVAKVKAPKTSTTTSTGQFRGKTRHVTKGTAKVEITADGSATVFLGDDFSLDNGPAPVVALGRNGYKKETILGKLEKLKGSQSYKIPDTLKAEDFNEVWIWCTDFDVPLGVAKLRS